MITVQMVLDRLIEPVGQMEKTVDTLKSGRLDAEVRKIAVVFMTTYAVIQQAIKSGADLIITHEPTYYNHMDEGEWLSGDPVYEKKRALIEESGVAIFRLHDYVHSYKPDGILVGMLKQLEWETYADPADRKRLTPPSDEHSYRAHHCLSSQKQTRHRQHAGGRRSRPASEAIRAVAWCLRRSFAYQIPQQP